MKQVGPLIYQDQFCVVQRRLHTGALDIEVLHGKADYQKHQDGQNDRFDYFPQQSVPLLKIKF